MVHKLKSLRELADEAAEELPTTSTPTAIPDDSGPPKHPAAEGSGNPLLEEDGVMDDPVDMDEVDSAVSGLVDSVAWAMEEHGVPEWRQTGYKPLEDAGRDAIVKYATPKANR